MFHVKHFQKFLLFGGEIMDVGTITNLIGSVGFPIVMCIMLYSRMCKQDEKHEEEIKALNETINNNTIAINTLTTKLDTALQNKEG